MEDDVVSEAIGEAPLGRVDYARFARLPDEALMRQCEVQTFHATGPGGQCVNTSDSAVRLRHFPTGIAVVSRESRSQHANRLVALAKLRAILERRSAKTKVRKPTRVSKAQRQRRLDAKHATSRKKAARSRVRPDE